MSADSRLHQYLLLSKGARGRAVAEIINKATSEPGILSFGELLDVPSVQEIKNGDFASSYKLLELFAYGTWPEYLEHASSLPPLDSQQQRKLKQLTVLSLAGRTKVIPYKVLMAQLDIPAVRELEDFIITECFYNSSSIKGKLDHKLSCLQVHNVISRDVRPQQLLKGSEKPLAAIDQRVLYAVMETEISMGAPCCPVPGKEQWFKGSESLLAAIDKRVQYAVVDTEVQRKHRSDVEMKQEEVKRSIKYAVLETEVQRKHRSDVGMKQEEVKRSIKLDMDQRGADMHMDDGGLVDFMEDDRTERDRMPSEIME
eukprot:gene11183-18797_t